MTANRPNDRPRDAGGKFTTSGDAASRRPDGQIHVTDLHSHLQQHTAERVRATGKKIVASIARGDKQSGKAGC